VPKFALAGKGMHFIYLHKANPGLMPKRAVPWKGITEHCFDILQPDFAALVQSIKKEDCVFFIPKVLAEESAVHEITKAHAVCWLGDDFEILANEFVLPTIAKLASVRQKFGLKKFLCGPSTIYNGSFFNAENFVQYSQEFFRMLAENSHQRNAPYCLVCLEDAVFRFFQEGDGAQEVKVELAEDEQAFYVGMSFIGGIPGKISAQGLLSYQDADEQLGFHLALSNTDLKRNQIDLLWALVKNPKHAPKEKVLTFFNSHLEPSQIQTSTEGLEEFKFKPIGQLSTGKKKSKKLSTSLKFSEQMVQTPSKDNRDEIIAQLTKEIEQLKAKAPEGALSGMLNEHKKKVGEEINKLSGIINESETKKSEVLNFANEMLRARESAINELEEKYKKSAHDLSTYYKKSTELGKENSDLKNENEKLKKAINMLKAELTKLKAA
jgi:hypothetical protein